MLEAHSHRQFRATYDTASAAQTTVGHFPPKVMCKLITINFHYVDCNFITEDNGSSLDVPYIYNAIIFRRKRYVRSKFN